MTPIDIGILAVVGLSALLGLARGAVREIFGLAALILGFALALGQYAEGALLLAPWIADSLAAQAAAFFAIFIAAWILFSLAGALVRRVMKLLALGWLDRLGGLVFGLARGSLLVALVAWSFIAFGIQPEQLVSSEMSRKILSGGEAITDLFPPTFASRFDAGLRSARETFVSPEGRDPEGRQRDTQSPPGRARPEDQF
ncbi:MAG: CvpA family protein [Deltaproteobacteria bacterium]|nr:CvpA family protein [Deltaproteobacteria bacterium]